MSKKKRVMHMYIKSTNIYGRDIVGNQLKIGMVCNYSAYFVDDPCILKGYGDHRNPFYNRFFVVRPLDLARMKEQSPNVYKAPIEIVSEISLRRLWQLYPAYRDYCLDWLDKHPEDRKSSYDKIQLALYRLRRICLRKWEK